MEGGWGPGSCESLKSFSLDHTLGLGWVMRNGREREKEKQNKHFPTDSCTRIQRFRSLVALGRLQVVLRSLVPALIARSSWNLLFKDFSSQSVRSLPLNFFFLLFFSPLFFHCVSACFNLVNYLSTFCVCKWEKIYI